MRKPWSWFVLSLAQCLAPLGLPSHASAKVLEHHVAVEVDARGKVTERCHLRVLIETGADNEDWQRYWIYLDDHRRLVSLDGAVLLTGGKNQKIGWKDRDVVQAAGSGAFHSSARYQMIDLPNLTPGSTLELSYAVEENPYWPGGVLPVTLAGEVTEGIELSVRVDPSAGPLRFRVDGPSDGLTIDETAQSVIVRGRRPEPERLSRLGGGGTTQSFLRWAWGNQATWEDLGGWYSRLLAEVPQRSPRIEKLARELTSGAATPRAKLEALVDYVRRKVRYVAVEVGIGGFRPHPPSEVASNLWGDCKDKSLLLVDLARAVGLDAWPVLVRLDKTYRIDRAFPAPYAFNHAIVAFAAAPLEPFPADPVADGYFFVDPTQEIGAASYLHQGVQGQNGVVVLHGRGKLVELPTLPATAGRKLTIELKLGADGSASGRAMIELAGDSATPMLQKLDAAASQAPLEESLRQLFAVTLRGARLTGLVYQAEKGDLPRFSAAIMVDHSNYLEGLDRGGSLRVEGLHLFPESRDFEGIEQLFTAATGSGILEQNWIFELPPGMCAPVNREEKVENAIGLFLTTLTGHGQRFQLTRHAELRRSWVEREDFLALKELSIAEGRAQQRRFRFACKD